MKRYLDVFKQTWTEFGGDKAQRLAAALAYYTIFSIAPLLIIAVAIAGLVFGRSAAQAQILAQLRGLFGEAGGKAIQEMLTSASKPKSGTIAIIIGAVTLLFGASGVFGQLKDAMNTIWNVEEKKSGGIAAMIHERFLSFAMVLGVGFLLLVSLVLDAAIAAVGKFAGQRLPGGEGVWQTMQLVVSFAVIAVLFAMIFKFLPDVKIEWHDVWLGAGFTSLFFVLGKLGLGLWLGKASVGSAYGAAGSLVVLLLWIFWSANILFFGAEFTQVYTRMHGSKKGESEQTSGPAASQAADRHDKSQPPQSESPPPKIGSRLPIAAAGGAIGLVLGILIAAVGSILMIVKSVKKLFA